LLLLRLSEQVFFEQLGKADALEKKLLEFNSTLGGSADAQQRQVESERVAREVARFVNSWRRSSSEG
jgi:hypothetical protein